MQFKRKIPRTTCIKRVSNEEDKKNGNKKVIRSPNIKDISNNSWSDNEELGRRNMKLTGHIDGKLEGKAPGHGLTSSCE